MVMPMSYTSRTNNCQYVLESCVWEITLACCFSCSYCGSGAGDPRENELSTVECIDVAEQLAEMGCRRVSLIGGEVFMRQDWDIIVNALTNHNIRVSIITNGYPVTPEMISKIKKANIESVAVSLDGMENTHDSFRQKGSFQKVLNTIDSLLDNGIMVSVITTLHSMNVDELDQMYELLRKKRIYAWQLQACSPMGNALERGLLTEIDFRKPIGFVRSHSGNAPFMMGVADNIGYYTDGEGSLRGNLSGHACFRGCKAGLRSIGIDSVGNVRGCESMYDDTFIEGNLRERKLREIWNDPDAFAYNRRFTVEQLEGKCKDCQYGKRCAGGCRSYNFFTGGHLYLSLRCAK